MIDWDGTEDRIHFLQQDLKLATNVPFPYP